MNSAAINADCVTTGSLDRRSSSGAASSSSGSDPNRALPQRLNGAAPERSNQPPPSPRPALERRYYSYDANPAGGDLKEEGLLTVASQQSLLRSAEVTRQSVT
jgi:hypothetical protein